LKRNFRPEENIGWNIAVGGGKPSGWERGTKLPEWIKKKIATGKRGKKFADTHKLNLAKAKLGKTGTMTNNYKGEIKATNISTGECFIFQGAAAMEKFGFHDSAIYKCIKGKQRQHKGHTF
jgi:hypothetical protein